MYKVGDPLRPTPQGGAFRREESSSGRFVFISLLLFIFEAPAAEFPRFLPERAWREIKGLMDGPPQRLATSVEMSRCREHVAVSFCLFCFLVLLSVPPQNNNGSLG